MTNDNCMGAAMNELRYERLADDVAGMIAGGVLRAGERLPSVRRLAEERRVSVSTAVQAFRQLEQRGLVEARPQSGFFVRARPQPLLASAAPAAPEAPVLVELNQRLVGVLEANNQPGIVPLGAALPAPALLPIAALHRRYASVARRFPQLLEGGSHTAINDPQLVRQLVRSPAVEGALEKALYGDFRFRRGAVADEAKDQGDGRPHGIEGSQPSAQVAHSRRMV